MSEVLDPAYMSEEETNRNEEGVRVRHVLPNRWESADFRAVKKELDAIIPKILSTKELETQLVILRTSTPNQRSAPKRAPKWVLKK